MMEHKDIISSSGLEEELQDQLLGLKALSWDISKVEVTAKQVDNIVNGLSIHVSEHFSQLDRLKESEKEILEILEKETRDFKNNPLYQLYDAANTSTELLKRIIGYLALEVEVLSNTNNKFLDLLIDAKMYGIQKQKIETELTVLNSVKSTFGDLLEKISKSYDERLKYQTQMFSESQERSMNGFNNILKETTKVVETLKDSRDSSKALGDVQNLAEVVKKLSEEIEKMKSKKKEEVETEVKTVQPQQYYIEPETSTSRSKKQFEQLVNLMRGGITDRGELLTRLHISPGQLNTMYKLAKEIIEKELGESLDDTSSELLSKDAVEAEPEEDSENDNQDENEEE